MRVALVAPLVAAIREPQRGGSQAFVADLARGLLARGHEVHLYAASGSEVDGVEVVDTGVDPEGLAATLYRSAQAPARTPAPAPGRAAAAAAFARVYDAVRDTRYDVVHNHAFDAPAVELSRSLQAPVVHTLHLPPEPSIAAALEHGVGADRRPTTACVSMHQARAWRRFVQIDAVLAPYVPTSAIPFSSAVGAGGLFAGRLSPEKGAAEAIEIARIAGVPLDVYGDDYDPDYTRDHIDPRRADPGVVVHPGVPRTTLWELMGRAAVVLCPAMWDEPFGMAAAEAQACGTPVVAFRRGALPEAVVDGVTGFLVEPGDLKAAAGAIELARSLSRAACREHAERRLDLELSLDAHERLYERVAMENLGATARG